MPRLLLNDPGVLHVRRNLSFLKQRPVQGRGFSSIVTPGLADDSVFKLTQDRHNYAYLTDAQAPRGTFHPKVFSDLGIVGHTSLGMPLYLVEMERLAPLGTRQQVHRQVASVFKSLRSLPPLSSFGRTFPPGVLAKANLPADLRAYLESLEQFAVQQDARLDATIEANMMCRANGELVIVDPLFDASL